MSAIPRIKDFDDPNYDPFLADEEIFGDHENPYPALAELRRRGSVHEGDFREFFGLRRDITFPPEIRHFMVLGYAVRTRCRQGPTCDNGKTGKGTHLIFVLGKDKCVPLFRGQ